MQIVMDLAGTHLFLYIEIALPGTTSLRILSLSYNIGRQLPCVDSATHHCRSVSLSHHMLCNVDYIAALPVV
jgi:hypothetical protein